MRLTTFLVTGSTLYGFRTSSRDDTIGLFSETLASRGLIQNESDVSRGLTRTEDGHTTVIGNGVAIPHATVAGLDATLLMVAVSEDPVAYGPAEGDGCYVFFVLLSPPGRGGQHIRLLARIARLASDPDAVELLRSAGSDELLRKALQTMDDRR
jgi:PTS system nitrogen regulatory IIA component